MSLTVHASTSKPLNYFMSELQKFMSVPSPPPFFLNWKPSYQHTVAFIDQFYIHNKITFVCFFLMLTYQMFVFLHDKTVHVVCFIHLIVIFFFSFFGNSELSHLFLRWIFKAREEEEGTVLVNKMFCISWIILFIYLFI